MKNRATLIGTLAIALWSLLALLTAASGDMPAFELTAMTFGIAGTLGVGIGALRSKLHVLIQPWPVWALGVGGLFCYHALYFAALQLAPPAQAGLVAYLWPLLIVLFSAALPGEHLASRHIVGALMGFAGVAVLVVGHRDAAIAAGALPGFALAFVAALVWALYSVLSRRVKHVPSDAVAGFCLATAAIALAMHLTFEKTVWPNSAGQWLAILALGLGPVGVAFYVWDYGVKHGDIRFLGVASYAAPVLSTLLLVAFGLAPATQALGLACGLIVGGAIVAALVPGVKKPA